MKVDAQSLLIAHGIYVKCDRFRMYTYDLFFPQAQEGIVRTKKREASPRQDLKVNPRSNLRETPSARLRLKVREAAVSQELRVMRPSL